MALSDEGVVILDQITVTRYLNTTGEECIILTRNDDDAEHSVVTALGMLQWAVTAVGTSRLSDDP